MSSTVSTDLRVQGNVNCQTLTVQTASVTGAMLVPAAEILRSQLKQEALAVYPVNLANLRVHDAIATNLPASAATDDLGFDTGTFGTEAPHVTAGDLKAAGATTRYARFLVALPAEYDSAETVQIRVNTKMETTIADTTCTVDVEAYEVASDLTVGSDLCTTAAQDMNSTSAADKDFTISATSLLPGDVLDVRVAIACNDAATGTAVEPVISKIALLADVRG